MSVTALDDSPTIGRSFSMECSVAVAKDVVGSVDIIWTVNGTVRRRVNNIVGNTVDAEYVLHRDLYNIPLLQLSDNNTVYYCQAIVNTTTPLSGSDSITLTIGKLLAVYIYVYSGFFFTKLFVK